ncbi:spore-associated protein [Nocardiopsis sp. CNS-639]|uniref:spore-associated protein n=1 Tax=Nocardiopsis sp. CNS-639 TaxID=1169153 RepID=UPI001E64A50C|nr:spore-associated protein [Nocardiopsis sp. CNS-639]
MPRKNWKRRCGTLAAAVATVASILVLSSATTAQGADPAQVCNSGPNRPADAGTFGWVNETAVPNGQGTVYLYYDNAGGYNCAVTIGTAGTMYMDVGLRQSGSGGGTWDSGTFDQYAGPVYVHAPGICVDTTGAVGDQSATLTGTNCGS